MRNVDPIVALSITYTPFPILTLVPVETLCLTGEVYRTKFPEGFRHGRGYRREGRPDPLCRRYSSWRRHPHVGTVRVSWVRTSPRRQGQNGESDKIETIHFRLPNFRVHVPRTLSGRPLHVQVAKGTSG